MEGYSGAVQRADTGSSNYWDSIFQALLDLIFDRLGVILPNMKDYVDNNMAAWADMLPAPYGDEIKVLEQ